MATAILFMPWLNSVGYLFEPSSFRHLFGLISIGMQASFTRSDIQCLTGVPAFICFVPFIVDAAE